MSTLTKITLTYKVVSPYSLKLGCAYSIVTPEEKKERDSTIRNKAFFLDFLEKSRGVITVVCQKTNIARATYYRWLESDEDFANKVNEIINAKVDILEDRLYIKAVDGDIKAITYLLDRWRYKKQSEGKKESQVHIYHHVDKKIDQSPITLEDIIDKPELFKIYLAWNEDKKNKFWETFDKGKYKKGGSFLE